MSAECVGERDEELSVAVTARTVSEDQTAVVWGLRSVKMAADGGIEYVVEKCGHVARIRQGVSFLIVIRIYCQLP